MTTQMTRTNGNALGASSADEFMPILHPEDIKQRLEAIRQFYTLAMTAGEDYGKVPGAGDKPTLLKPGAEKLCTLFGLTPRPVIVEHEEDWTGERHGDEPFFYYWYRVGLYRGERLIAEADGSCNSWEKKYRYRSAERLCPICGKATIKRSKFEDKGFYCYGKVGGCDAKFRADDVRIVNQQTGTVTNPDIADIVNTLQKMAQKRALVAAVLLATGASQFFTQDVEDMPQFAELPNRTITVDDQTGEVYERTQVQPARASDPPADAHKHEREDGTTIHAPTVDPATGRPAAAVYRNEDAPRDDFAPRTTAEDAALGKHIASLKGWMTSRKLDPENRELAIYLLNRASAGANPERAHEPAWTSRKDLTSDDWKACMKALIMLKPPDLALMVQGFYDQQKPAPDAEPYEPCICCGSTDPVGSCACTMEQIADARANAEAERLTGMLIDVDTPAQVSGAFA